MRSISAVLCLTLVVACGSEPPKLVSPTSAASTSEPTDAPAPGYTLTPPTTWRREARAEGERFTDPDGTVVTDLLVRKVNNLDTLVDELVRSEGIDMPERQRVHSRTDDTFELVTVLTFASDDQQRFAQIIAQKRGPVAYVFIVRGPLKDIARREAELHQLMGSLKIEGAEEKTLDPKDRKALTPDRLEKLYAVVDAVRQAEGVPGLALAVVDGERVYSRGFGVRADGGAAVDADTQFMIGSVTKSFSTLLIATLVDAGALDWETPVQEIYPDFRLADAELTSRLQVQDLFCACTGLPRADFSLVFEFAGKGPKDLFATLAGLSPTTAMNETFQYNNQLTAAGGYVAGHVAFPKESDLRSAYQQALRARVLDPLGMSSTTMDKAAVRKRGNHALPHSLDIDGKTEAVPLGYEDFVLPLAPAGALWSTANDMARYVKLQLSRGLGPDGKRVASQAALDKTQTGRVKTGSEGSYALGWAVGRAWGLRAIGHGGGTFGFGSDVTFFPDLDLGIFIVGNRIPDGAVLALAKQRLLELVFDTNLGAEEKARERLNLRAESLATGRSKLADGLPPAALLGSYRNADLGPVTLRREGDRMILDAGEWTSTLRAIQASESPNTLLLLGGPGDGLPLRYELSDPPVLITSDGQHEYRFTRK